MIAGFAQGAGFGYAAGVTPGPLQIFLITQTLRYGWRHGLWIVLSPLISDGPVVALVLLVLQGASDTLLDAVRLVGGAFVLYLAWGLWRGLRRGDAVPDLDALAGDGGDAVSPWDALRKAVAINALGPGPWLFWGTAMGPEVIGMWRESPPSAVAFVVGFYGIFLGVMVAETALVHQARRLGRRTIAVGLWIGLAVLVVFALSLWREALV